MSSFNFTITILKKAVCEIYNEKIRKPAFKLCDVLECPNKSPFYSYRIIILKNEKLKASIFHQIIQQSMEKLTLIMHPKSFTRCYHSWNIPLTKNGGHCTFQNLSYLGGGEGVSNFLLERGDKPKLQKGGQYGNGAGRGAITFMCPWEKLSFLHYFHYF